MINATAAIIPKYLEIFKNFVDKCEGLMIEETNNWKKYIERAKEMK